MLSTNGVTNLELGYYLGESSRRTEGSTRARRTDGRTDCHRRDGQSRGAGFSPLTRWYTGGTSHFLACPAPRCYYSACTGTLAARRVRAPRSSIMHVCRPRAFIPRTARYVTRPERPRRVSHRVITDLFLF